MFYRRKVILALLQAFDDELDKIRLQKLLFLFTQRQVKSAYDFIPYKFGCFSYSANVDMTTMTSKGILLETKSHFKKADKTDYLKQLKSEDKKLLHEVKTAYGDMNARALMKYTYLKFPFYAIKSEAAEKILNEKQLDQINAAAPDSTKTVLFTIGYEGISLEKYLVRLLQHDVKILIDVRNNALSMKFGFSKSQLKRYCESLGIQYIHIPEVGIQSEKRQELNTQADYDKLFSFYRKNNLKKTKGEQEKILSVLEKYKRIALTCFEADSCQCHRKHLAESIAALPGFNYVVKHI